MMWFLACLAIAAVGLISWIMLRLSWYRRLFAVPHLMEFSQGLAAVKRAAMRDMIVSDEKGVQPPDDARILRTSAGLALLYTVSLGAAGTYVHHASVSVPGRPTAHAVGETFILLWAKLLGVEYGRLALDVSPMTVHHAEFVLNEREQSELAQRPVEMPTAEWLQVFLAECTAARQSLRRDRSLVRDIRQPI
jgi:hypothetical protein